MGLAGATVCKCFSTPAGGSDDFNRASLGSLWISDSGTWNITSNQLKCPGLPQGTCSIHYDSILPDNQYAQIKFIGGPGDRIPVHGVYTRSGGYYAGWSGFNRYYIIEGNSHPSLGTVLNFVSGSPSSGDTWKLESIGNTHNFYVNGVLTVTGTGSTYPTGNYAGVTSNPSDVGTTFDDFVCGAA